MSNIVHFPSAGGAAARASGRAGSAHVGSGLLSEPPAHAHAVQFYDDEPFLLETVAYFLSAGLSAGEAALIIATPAHTDGIVSQIPKDVRDSAFARGELLLVDADAMLARFMRADEPVASSFEAAIERVFDSLSPSRQSSDPSVSPRRRVRAFGEMVDLLWKRGNIAAALRLEELWNRTSARYDLALLCGYGLRNFHKADDASSFDEVCQLHTHVLPTEHFARDAGDVFGRLREISVLEQRAHSLESEVAYRQELESALRAALRSHSERKSVGVADGAAEVGASTQGLPAESRSRLPTLLRARLAMSHLLSSALRPLPGAPKAAAGSRYGRLLVRVIEATRARVERRLSRR